MVAPIQQQHSPPHLVHTSYLKLPQDKPISSGYVPVVVAAAHRAYLLLTLNFLRSHRSVHLVPLEWDLLERERRHTNLVHWPVALPFYVRAPLDMHLVHDGLARDGALPHRLPDGVALAVTVHGHRDECEGQTGPVLGLRSGRFHELFQLLVLCVAVDAGFDHVAVHGLAV